MKLLYMERPQVIASILGLMVIGATTALADIVQESGDFVAEVDRLKTLAFAKDSGLYVPPASQQQDAFASMAASMLAGQTAIAEGMASSLGYEVVEFTDTNSSLVFYELREVLQGGAQTNGWGSYFVNLSSEVADLIEVPHPLFDSYSWDVGARIFIDSQAKAFLMAGAHRDANGSGTADVAHLTNTIFHAVHRAWDGETGENPAWQIHGFNADNYPTFPANTDAVLSNGDGGISREIMNLDGCFQATGFLSYAYNTLATNSPENLQVNDGESGSLFALLGATLNVQGIHSRSVGGAFVHVELARSIRFNSTNRTSVAALVSNGIRESSRIPPRIGISALATPTSVVMVVDDMVRSREYQIQECTDLVSGYWSTGMTFTAETAATNLTIAISNDWQWEYFRATLTE